MFWNSTGRENYLVMKYRLWFGNEGSFPGPEIGLKHLSSPFCLLSWWKSEHWKLLSCFVMMPWQLSQSHKTGNTPWVVLCYNKIWFHHIISMPHVSYHNLSLWWGFQGQNSANRSGSRRKTRQYFVGMVEVVLSNRVQSQTIVTCWQLLVSRLFTFFCVCTFERFSSSSYVCFFFTMQTTGWQVLVKGQQQLDQRSESHPVVR